jgi:hypothetical protein
VRKGEEPVKQQTSTFRDVAPYLALFVPFAIAGFWLTYFSRILSESSPRVHLHGLAMSGWLAMLIGQAYFIRINHRVIHRAIGKVSYVFVPVLSYSICSMAHYRLVMSQADFSPAVLYFLSVQLALLAMFLVAYGMAIANRCRPMIHARYMMCTALTLIDPIGARLLFNHAGISFPLGQVLTYGLTDALLIFLALRDRRVGLRPEPFLVMLVVFVALETPTFFVYHQPWWHAFAAWVATFPFP